MGGANTRIIVIETGAMMMPLFYSIKQNYSKSLPNTREYDMMYNQGYYNQSFAYSGDYNNGRYNSGTYEPQQLLTDFTEFAAGKLDLYIDQGDTFKRRVTLKDCTGIPIDISGYNIVASMKQYYNSTRSISLHATVIDYRGGVLELSKDEIETSNMSSSRYVYEVKLFTNEDQVKVLQGQALMTNF
jgi:hypothetical protein